MEFVNLLPAFGGLVWTVLAFVLALSIIVAVHEYGHYIVGRWSGIHAEVFSLGFGPVVYSRIDKRGTKWQLAALPFGGFVKFLGDSSAASGKDGEKISGLSDAERRRTMHGAPLWARAATVAAGPVFNFILSIVVFFGLFLSFGVTADLPVIGSMKPLPFEGQSLLPGDQILSVSGIKTADFDAFVAATKDLPVTARVDYLVQRDGASVSVSGPYPLPPVADAVQPRSAASDAGVKAGDVILAINGQPVSAFEEVRAAVGASDGKPLSFKIWRAGADFEATMIPQRRDLPKDGGGFETRWLIGMSGGLMFVPELRTPGLFEAASLAVQGTWKAGTTNLSFLWNIVIGNVSTCNVSGPIGIAKVSGDAARQGIDSFIMLIALLSTSVGLLNLFPIPVLDGGHLVFHAFEAVTGKPPSDRVLRVLMGIGLTALLGLMAFAVTNDIFCP
ncbi:MAG: RIP metalloprotease RseP [Rhodoferax sp.]|nr:RIP metalloprotease RseP [Pseudorhodobacter sp.]